jgi:hypothetical protein
MKKMMPRRQKNKTKYCQDSKCIVWQIEWCFHGSINTGRSIIYIESNVEEIKTIKHCLQQLINNNKPTLADIIAEEPDMEKWAILIKNPKNKGEIFFKLNPEETIKQSLEGKTVWEYPSLHIILEKNLPQFELFNTLLLDHFQKKKEEELLQLETIEKEVIEEKLESQIVSALHQDESNFEKEEILFLMNKNEDGDIECVNDFEKQFLGM